MANVSISLRRKLLESSELTSLIGQRMYPDVLKQNATLPAVVYTKISTLREHTIDDVTGLSHSRFEFRCVADSREAADMVARALQTSGICSYRGTVAGITFCGTQIETGDDYEQLPPTDGNQVHRYVTTFDFMVHYKESL